MAENSSSASVEETTTPKTQAPLQKIVFFWLIGGVFYLYQSILKVSPSVIFDDLISTFGISASHYGAISSFFYGGYALMQIPIGVLLDRHGARKLMAASIMFCASGSFIFSISPTWPLLLLARLLIGIGASGAFIGTMKIITMWFSVRLTPIFAGFTVVAGALGSILGNKPFQSLTKLHSWKVLYFWLAVIGFGLSVLAFLFLRDRKVEADSNSTASDFKSLFIGLRKIIVNPQIILIAAFAFLIYMPLSVIADTWGVTFLETMYPANSNEAAEANSLIYIGLAVGSTIFGYIASITPNYRIIFRIVSVAQLPVLSILIWFKLPNFYLVEALLVMLGLLLGGQALKFNAAFANASPEYTGAIVGFVNMCCMLSGFIFQQGVGYLLDLSWMNRAGALSPEGKPAYAEADFAFALSTHLIALALCFFITYFIKNKINEEATEE